jgi:hypothetical protein
MNAVIDPSAAVVVSIASGISATAASLTLGSGDEIVLAGGSLTAADTIDALASAVLAGFGAVTGPLTNDGTVTASGGDLTLNGAITGTGSQTIAAGATLEIGAADAQAVNFATSSGTLKLDDPGAFSGVLNGLTAGDVIDLPTLPYGHGIIRATLSGNDLVVSDVPPGVPVTSGNSYAFSLGSTFLGEGFGVSSDGSHGTDITVLSHLNVSGA